jgi:DNA adenine methylase
MSIMSVMNVMSNTKFQKPFIKWVGGKTQIINNIMSKFPKEIENYHELFLGGGSVLLALLTLKNNNEIKVNNKIYAYDINERLINVYKHIQNNKDELFEYINLYINEYHIIKESNGNKKPITIEEAKTSKESYYYWIRNKFNKIEKDSIESSALFMVMNKINFRGMYREGPNGYNIPFGNPKNTPTIITKSELDYISNLIKDVEFIHSNFTESIKNIKENDFVYLDPPYAPKNKKSFVGYVNDGFTLELHNKLFDEVKKLDKNKVKFIMSNSKVDLVIENFKDFNSEDIIARRAINSKNPGSKTTEVIICNYL